VFERHLENNCEKVAISCRDNIRQKSVNVEKTPYTTVNSFTCELLMCWGVVVQYYFLPGKCFPFFQETK
jgi:hypothetical protein